MAVIAFFYQNINEIAPALTYLYKGVNEITSLLIYLHEGVVAEPTNIIAPYEPLYLINSYKATTFIDGFHFVQFGIYYMDSININKGQYHEIWHASYIETGTLGISNDLMIQLSITYMTDLDNNLIIQSGDNKGLTIRKVYATYSIKCLTNIVSDDFISECLHRLVLTIIFGWGFRHDIAGVFMFLREFGLI